MARKDSEHQKKSMSKLFRGRAIFKPLNTGWIDDHVACVREWIANIFFYTKNGTAVMIDAGYNYERLREKMNWLDIDPASIRDILITHQDTDHVGALETDSELLFKNAAVYIGEIENRYLTGEKRRKVFHGLYKLPMVKMDNKKTLLKDGQIFFIGDIKIECILVPGHTWGHMVYLIDDVYLFTGDAIWFGADGGYSFLSTLAEDNRLAVQSLAKLEENIRARNRRIAVIKSFDLTGDSPKESYKDEGISYKDGYYTLHRIVEIREADASGDRELFTRGDNNPGNDLKTVMESGYVSKVAWHLNYVGAFMRLMFDYKGLYWLIGICAALTITIFVMNIKSEEMEPSIKT